MTFYDMSFCKTFFISGWSRGDPRNPTGDSCPAVIELGVALGSETEEVIPPCEVTFRVLMDNDTGFVSDSCLEDSFLSSNVTFDCGSFSALLSLYLGLLTFLVGFSVSFSSGVFLLLLSRRSLTLSLPAGDLPFSEAFRLLTTFS